MLHREDTRPKAQRHLTAWRLAAAAVVICHSATASPIGLLEKRADLTSCLYGASLSPVTVGASSFDADTAPFNQRIQPSPAAIVFPSTRAEVASAVQCAASASASVSARSGGHSYAAYGLSGQLVIDLVNFQDVTLQGDIASVGGGAKLGDIALALNGAGRALPHGVCPFVGIGGHAGFGGFGYPSRMWGLTLDTVVGYDVVLANGTHFTNLTAAQDPDLFWALNGAAPNYGIITTYHFRTFAAPPAATNFKYSYPAGNLSPKQAAAVFSAYQSFGAASAPAELGLTCTLGPGGSIDLSGVYYGTSDSFGAVINPFLQSLPEGYSTSVETLSWIDSVQALAGDQKLNTTGAADYRDDFSAKSIMTPEATPISEDALDSFFNYIFDTQTSTNWFIEVNLYGGNNSVINQRNLNESSFGRRDSLLTFQIYASSPTYGPPYPEEGFDWLNGAYNSIVSPMTEAWGTSLGAYVNYVDPTLTANETQQLYWADQYSRLAELRGRYDPKATFNYPQAIVATA